MQGARVLRLKQPSLHLPAGICTSPCCVQNHVNSHAAAVELSMNKDERQHLADSHSACLLCCRHRHAHRRRHHANHNHDLFPVQLPPKHRANFLARDGLTLSAEVGQGALMPCCQYECSCRLRPHSSHSQHNKCISLRSRSWLYRSDNNLCVLACQACGQPISSLESWDSGGRPPICTVKINPGRVASAFMQPGLSMVAVWHCPSTEAQNLYNLPRIICFMIRLQDGFVAPF